MTQSRQTVKVAAIELAQIEAGGFTPLRRWLTEQPKTSSDEISPDDSFFDEFKGNYLLRQWLEECAKD